jgi:hypothetical protein
MVRAAVWAMAVATVTGACGLTPAGVSSASCGNIAGGACDEQIAIVAARHPGATSVDLECMAPACDRTGGHGKVVVTMPDGTTLDDTFAYVGDPNPPPPPQCRGLPVDVCRDTALQQAENVAPSKRIVAIAVACTSPACTAAQGEASVTIRLGDGSTEEHGTSWSAGQP